jgi:phosphoenolpyruvate carboxykinase (ATP)
MRDIRLSDTMGILDSVIRGGLEDWTVSERTGLPVPRSIRLADSILVHPERLFAVADFEQRQRAMDRHRSEYVNRFPGLHPDIRGVFQ